MKIVERKVNPSVVATLEDAGISPVLAKVFAGRGVSAQDQATPTLDKLIPYTELKGAVEMANILADAIIAGKKLRVVADYDADGATACTIAIRGLRAFGANVDFLIPNRLEHGYGLTPEIAELAASPSDAGRPDYLITVDNGIASHAGIDRANALGVPVLVTDHHLPAETHPNAMAIVNPNQHGCTFPSKSLAGCGVMFYVLWALQDELFSRDFLSDERVDQSFTVEKLLPIAAIGTVADVVALDTNNRIIVHEGISLIRKGVSFPGIDALAKAAGRNPRELATSDIAFGIGPRINAAGRLETMDAGVECLTTDSVARALALAKLLHEINDKRKEIETDMTDDAVRQLLTEVQESRYTAVLHNEDWHQGVIGIVAGRIKERVWRPTFALANGKNGEIKGSGRSIPGFHLRDALADIDAHHPGLLPKFGGHAAAAGVTIRAGGLQEFSEAFEKVARKMLKPADLQQCIEVDGSLDNADMCLDTVVNIKQQVWGQAFPEPSFCDEFDVVEAKPIGGGLHLRLVLEKDGKKFQGVKFRHAGGVPQGRIRVVYKLDANKFRDETNLQLLVEYLEEANTKTKEPKAA